MIKTKQTSLHEQVVEVAAQYLGPAARRFIDRQIQSHLHKEPVELTKADLKKLVDWIRLAVALLSDDRRMVDEFSDNLLALTGESPNHE